MPPPRASRRGRPPGQTRARASSVESTDSSYDEAVEALKTGTKPAEILHESTVVKRFAGTDANLAPQVLLSQATATVQGPDGSRVLANLLVEANKSSSAAVIVGVASVDNEYLDSLINEKMNHSKIVLSSLRGYSISDGPCAFWVLSDGGWFELQPSEEYRSTFDRNLMAIGITYMIQDVYLGKHTEPMFRGHDEIARIIERFTGQGVGTGWTLGQAVDILREHSDVIISQIEERELEIRQTRPKCKVLTTNNFYKWLKAGLPDLRPVKVMESIDPFQPEPHVIPPEQVAHDRDLRVSRGSAYSGNPASPFTSVDSQNPRSPPARTGMCIPYHGKYISQQYPNGVGDGSVSFVDAFLSIAFHAPNNRVKSQKDVTYQSVNTAVYRDYKVAWRSVVQELLMVWSSVILETLHRDREWAGSELAKGLVEISKQMQEDPNSTVFTQEFMDRKESSAAVGEFQKIKANGWKITHRRGTNTNREETNPKPPPRKSMTEPTHIPCASATAAALRAAARTPVLPAHLDPALFSPPLADSAYERMPAVEVTNTLLAKVAGIQREIDGSGDSAMTGMADNNAEDDNNEDPDSLFLPSKRHRHH